MQFRLKWLRVAQACLALTTAQVAQASDAGQYWPSVRHDARQTNTASTPAHLGQPGVRWRAPLTAPPGAIWAIDADVDGSDDVMYLASGRLAVRTVRGKLLWQTGPLGLITVLAVADFDGDALPEVLAAGQDSLALLDGLSGKTKWASASGQFAQLSAVAAGRFTAKTGPLQWAAGSAGQIGVSSPSIRVFGYVGGSVQQLAATTNSETDPEFGHALGTQFADVDGDGLLDVLLPGLTRFGAFSGKTGALLGTSPQLPAVPNAGLSARSVPMPGGAPLIVVQADNHGGAPTQQAAGWVALQLAGGNLQIVANQFAAVAKDERFRVNRGGPGDFDGDGKLELLVSRAVGDKWQFEAYDLPSGATLLVQASVPGETGGPLLHELVAGEPNLLLFSVEPLGTPAPFGHLLAATWSRQAGLKWAPALAKNCAYTDGMSLPPSDASDWQARPLATWLSVSPATQVPSAMLTCDDDGDMRAEHVRTVQFSATAPPAMSFEAAVLPSSAVGAPLRAAGADPKAPQAWRPTALLADGRINVWGPQGVLINDTDGDGKSDLRPRLGVQAGVVAAPWSAGGKLPALAAAVGNKVVAFDVAGAGPTVAPTELWVASWSESPLRVAFADMDGDGAFELTARYEATGGTATLARIGQDGSQAWKWQVPGAPARWQGNFRDPSVFVDIDGDGADELVAALAPQAGLPDQFQYVNVFSAKKKAWLWPIDGGCVGAYDSGFAVDAAASPPVLWATVYDSKWRCNAATGESLQKKVTPTTGIGVPMLSEIDGTGPLDMAVGGSWGGIAAYTGNDLSPLWSVQDQRYFGAPAALLTLPGTGAVHVQLRPDTSLVEARNAKTGALLWARTFYKGQSMPEEAAPKNTVHGQFLIGMQDLTGKGEPAVVVTTTDGWLYAARVADGALFWAMDFGGTLGSPIAADIDGDGEVELVLSVPSGELIALDGNVAAAPAWVRDLPAGAAADAQDVDMQEEATVLHASWAAVPGASAYLVRYVDDTGGEQVPQTQVGAATERKFGDLYLQPGKTYFAAVATANAAGADSSVSVETKSDGVTVVDQSPPWFADVRCDPACVLPAGATMSVLATAIDKTRLRSVQVDLEDNGAVATEQKLLTFSQTYAVKWGQNWPKPGHFRVWLAADDTADHHAQAKVDVQICAVGEVVVAGACANPPVAPAKKPPATNSKSINGNQRESCSAAPVAQLPLAGWLALAAAAMLLARRRISW